MVLQLGLGGARLLSKMLAHRAAMRIRHVGEVLRHLALERCEDVATDGFSAGVRVLLRLRGSKA